MARQRESAAGGSTSRGHGGARNRATPARLFKLYEKMTQEQRDIVIAAGFGGLLKIGSGRLPSAISKWLLKHFDTEAEELVIPGRGRIKVNAEAVHRILGLPMGEDPVEYEFNGVAINYINIKCGFEDGRASRITIIKEWLESSKEHNDDYLRFWLMLAISTFLCGSTALCISPKCYPALVDLSIVKEFNWCQFVVDTLKKSVGKMHKKDAVLGCLYFLTILYLDSLELGNIQIPQGQPRIAAWNMKLINKVIKLDTIRDGVFGKLRLKKSDAYVNQTSLFGDLHDIEKFISHRACTQMSSKKKRKLSEVVNKACIGFTEVIGTFISDVSAIDESSDDFEDQIEPRRRRSTRRTNTVNEDANLIVEDEDSFDDDEEEWVDDDDDDEEEDDVEADDEEQKEERADDEEQKEERAEDEEQKEEEKAPEKKDPTPLEVIPSQPASMRGSQKSRREKLRLPHSTVDDHKSDKPEESTKWDFSGPPLDLMRFIDCPTSPESQPAKAQAKANVRCSGNVQGDYDDDTWWDSIGEDDLQKVDEVVNSFAQAEKKASVPTKGDTMGQETKKTQNTCSTTARKAHIVPLGTPIEHLEENQRKTDMVDAANIQSASRTPAYQPMPRRTARVGRALQSPFIDYEKMKGMKCSKIAQRTYDVVCLASRRPTRSSSQSPTPQMIL